MTLIIDFKGATYELTIERLFIDDDGDTRIKVGRLERISGDTNLAGFLPMEGYKDFRRAIQKALDNEINKQNLNDNPATT